MDVRIGNSGRQIRSHPKSESTSLTRSLDRSWSKWDTVVNTLHDLSHL